MDTYSPEQSRCVHDAISESALHITDLISRISSPDMLMSVGIMFPGDSAGTPMVCLSSMRSTNDCRSLVEKTLCVWESTNTMPSAGVLS